MEVAELLLGCGLRVLARGESETVVVDAVHDVDVVDAEHGLGEEVEDTVCAGQRRSGAAGDVQKIISPVGVMTFPPSDRTHAMG